MYYIFHEISPIFLFFEQALDDNCYCTIAGDIAGGAEAIHGDVKRNHKCLLLSIEAKDGTERGKRRHNCSAGHSGGGNHHDSKHKDKLQEFAELHAHTGHQADGNGAACNLHRTAGHMDGGA